MLNDRQLYSVKQLLDFFKNMPILREREREMKCACVNHLHLFVCPYNNETVNLVLLQKHVVAEKYNRFSMEILQ